MFGIVDYGLFILSAILLNLTPGADTIYILGSSISRGRGAGILSALGVSTGCLIHTVMASLGLSVLLAQSALAFDVVKYLGAGYLVFLGIRAFLSKSSVIAQNDPGSKHSSMKTYLQGVMTNVLNPKVALFFLAFLPQYIDPNNAFGLLPFLLLGLTFITTGTLWCILLAVFSSFFAEKLARKPGVARWMNRVTGVVFVGLGLNLLRSKM